MSDTATTRTGRSEIAVAVGASGLLRAEDGSRSAGGCCGAAAGRGRLAPGLLILTVV
jgi:hypothetical protein